MELIKKRTIKIDRIRKSQLLNVDFDHIPFGKIFSDHMLVSDYANGNWGEPEIISFGDIATSSCLSALHYGQAFFEGMQAYKNWEGKPVLFRPWENSRSNLAFVEARNRFAHGEVNCPKINQVLQKINAWVPRFESYCMNPQPSIHFGLTLLEEIAEAFLPDSKNLVGRYESISAQLIRKPEAERTALFIQAFQKKSRFQRRIRIRLCFLIVGSFRVERATGQLLALVLNSKRMANQKVYSEVVELNLHFEPYYDAEISNIQHNLNSYIADATQLITLFILDLNQELHHYENEEFIRYYQAYPEAA